MARLALISTLLCVLALPSCRCSRTESSVLRTAPSVVALPSGVASTGVPARLDAHELTWVYPDSEVGPMHVVVVIPERRDAEQRFPVLVAMHGRGEALKGPTRGARGWVDDYWLPQALARLHDPPLTRSDFLGMVASDRLELINTELERRPYEGLVIVCPYTPDRLSGDIPFDRAAPLASFVVDELLPRVRLETPALTDPRRTGIDGVSLGGRASLMVGLLRPEAFGVVATLQPAFDVREVDELARRAARAVRQHRELTFRLVSSSGDYYLNSTRALARAFRAAGVEPNLLVAEGGHSYDFNRGPGVHEMLLFHDRALRGADWP